MASRRLDGPADELPCPGLWRNDSALPETLESSGVSKSDVPLILKSLQLCSQGHLALPLDEYGRGQGGYDDHQGKRAQSELQARHGDHRACRTTVISRKNSANRSGQKGVPIAKPTNRSSPFRAADQNRTD